MPQIILNGQAFDIDGIIFDKDGTLIDFHATWGPILRQAVDKLVEPFEDKEIITENVFKTLGVDQQSMQSFDGPYSIASFDKIYTVVSTVLYQHGMKWTDAEQRVLKIFKKAAETPPTLEQLSPTTHLPTFFDSLSSHGIKIGVATADNRHGTLDTLEKLQCNIDSIFLACADDLSLPSKPNPSLLDSIAQRWGTKTAKIAMVGDTIGDVYMAQKAGSVSIGVLTGAGTAEMLAPYCHVVLDSIQEIKFQ